MRFAFCFLAGLSATLAMNTVAHAETTFAFGLWGDVPHARSKDDPKMPALQADMNASDIAFSIFDGDKDPVEKKTDKDGQVTVTPEKGGLVGALANMAGGDGGVIASTKGPGIAAPHLEQNFAPTATGDPQLPQKPATQHLPASRQHLMQPAAPRSRTKPFRC